MARRVRLLLAAFAYAAFESLVPMCNRYVSHVAQASKCIEEAVETANACEEGCGRLCEEAADVVLAAVQIHKMAEPSAFERMMFVLGKNERRGYWE